MTAATPDPTDLVWLRRVRDRIDREYAQPWTSRPWPAARTCRPGT